MPTHRCACAAEVFKLLEEPKGTPRFIPSALVL